MGKIITYFMEVKNELSKVVWPTRAATIRYTGVVIVFSIVVAVILASADYGLIKLLEKVINR